MFKHGQAITYHGSGLTTDEATRRFAMKPSEAKAAGIDVDRLQSEATPVYADGKRLRDAGLRTQTEERLAWQETQAWEE